MATEVYSKAYESRCIARLVQWGAPISGWRCVDTYDTADGDSGDPNFHTCELCNCPSVRFVHVMGHPDHSKELHVGCICAGIMEGDILGAKAREREMRNRAKRKSNFRKKSWTEKATGNFTLRYKGNRITIVPSRTGRGGYGVYYAGGSTWYRDGNRISSFADAVDVAFDLIDPPAI